MTIKEIALQLLEKYEEAETSVIWEYSGDIEEDLERLHKYCDRKRKEIEQA